MATLGTRKNPAIVRVRTEERAERVLAFCQENDLQVIVGLEPENPDLSDVECALAAREPAPRAPKIGRNDRCSCGSGKKFKKCHGAPTPLAA